MCVAAGSVVLMFFFFKQERAYEMRISDWSSDVCSSDLAQCHEGIAGRPRKAPDQDVVGLAQAAAGNLAQHPEQHVMGDQGGGDADRRGQRANDQLLAPGGPAPGDRKSVVSGKRVSVRVDLGGRRIIKQKKTIRQINTRTKSK